MTTNDDMVEILATREQVEWIIRGLTTVEDEHMAAHHASPIETIRRGHASTGSAVQSFKHSIIEKRNRRWGT